VIWQGVGVFVLNVLFGGVWALFARACAKREVLKATLLDLVIVSIATTNALSYITYKAQMAPFVISGSVLGTYIALRFIK
jgi:hypothetical protein